MADEIISRRQAYAQGLKHYFSGIPCKRGHVADRSVATGLCTECPRDRNSTRKHDREAKAAYDAIYRQQNGGRKKATNAAWYLKNRERIAAAAAARYQKNKEHMAAASAAWYQQNRERKAKTRDAWKAANPDAVRAHKDKRRAAEGEYTAADVRRILKAQKGKCAYCRVAVGESYQVDHIVPLAKGGTNWPRNLQVLCGPCNMSKCARDPIEHAQRLGLLL